jgi:hypothetical protein
MTSQINFDIIDEQYPVAGQDNDSQGFRDNFNSIKDALSTAKVEITTLQNNSILSASLGTPPAPVDNDLLGSSINNGFYNNFHGVLRELPAEVSTQTNIDVTAGSIHSYDLAADPVSFTFTNWPDAGYYANVRVHFQGFQNGIFTPELFSQGGGDIVKTVDFPTSLATGVARSTDGTQAQSQRVLLLTSVAGIVPGQTAILTSYIPVDTTVVSVNATAKTVTLSQDIAAPISTAQSVKFVYRTRVIEAWSVDSGLTVYVKHIGDF